jgi:hypothetical protein
LTQTRHTFGVRLVRKRGGRWVPNCGGVRKRGGSFVVVAVAGIGLALWLGAGSVRAATLPTVRCPVETAMDGLKFP